jgi:hypothetical protein
MLLAGLALCAVGSWVEWTRALDGRAVAWAYAFEWPLFAVLGAAVWWRLLRSASSPPRVPPSSEVGARAIPTDDPELVAWNEYLARLHATDPPGGPPE